MSFPKINLYDVIDNTWPAADKTIVGPWTIRQGNDGGSRVSAATANTPISVDMVDSAVTAMLELNQTPIFMIRDNDAELDEALGSLGYVIKDPVNIYLAPIASVATIPPPPVTAFSVWEPLAIQIDIWAAGGISLSRIDIMHRAKGPKTSLIGRLNDHPAAAGFVAMHGNIAMVHALEILPHQRRQSMGIYAMRRAAFWAEEQGATHISCACTKANTGANALYSSLGMNVVEHYHYRIMEKAE